MIHTIRTITVGQDECVIDRPIMLYRGDRDLEVEFSLVGNSFMFGTDGNVLASMQAKYAQLVVNTPSGLNMFSDIVACRKGNVIFTIRGEMIDEIKEVGMYAFQIRLLDATQTSRVTLPPVYNGIEIRQPIAAEDQENVTGDGVVDYAEMNRYTSESGPTFNSLGDYNKTTWQQRDVISTYRMNKIEDALFTINENCHDRIDEHENIIKQLEANYNAGFENVNKNINERIEYMQGEVNEAEAAMNEARTHIDGAVAEMNTAKEDMLETKEEVIAMVDRAEEDLAAQVDADVAAAEVELKEYVDEKMIGTIDDRIEDILVNVKAFGATGDGITDDYASIFEAVEYCNQNKKTLYFPKGIYLLGSTIDFTNLSYVYDGCDNRFTFRMKGDDASNTILKAKTGVNKILYYNPSDKTKYKKFIISDLSFQSEEEYDDYTTRAKCSAIKLLCSPNCEINNVQMIGLEEGIHLKYCWLTKLNNVYMSRMTRGIHLDGTDDGGVIGQADHLFIQNIGVGGWTLEFGLKISSSKSSKIINFDSEAGSSGNGIILEGCHSIDVDTGYIENFGNAEPIKVKGLLPLDSLNKFSTDIRIKGFRFYNCSTRPIILNIGVHNLTVEDCFNEFNYTVNNPITNNADQFIGLASDDADYRGHYYRNISVVNNTMVDDNQLDLAFMERYGIHFKNNGITYVANSNYGYYSPTYQRGTILVELHKTPITRKFVSKSGSYGTLSGVTGTTTANSNIVAVNNTTDIIPGTYISIGEFERVMVLSKTDNRIVVSRVASSNQTDVAINYEPPILVDMA